MGSPWEGQAFLFMWIGFLLLMTGGIAVFFFWGVRSGQFANQERARFLALEAEIPGGGDSGPAPGPDDGNAFNGVHEADSLPRRGRGGEGEGSRPHTDGRHET